jgi:Mn-dependent DtxR family transcriptional regulator
MNSARKVKEIRALKMFFHEYSRGKTYGRHDACRLEHLVSAETVNKLCRRVEEISG